MAVGLQGSPGRMLQRWRLAEGQLQLELEVPMAVAGNLGRQEVEYSEYLYLILRQVHWQELVS